MTISQDFIAGTVHRRALVGGLVGISMIAAATPVLAAPSGKAKTALLTSLREEADFTVPPHRVYEALLDEKQFTTFSGASAKINRSEGGMLSLFGGQIMARNLELVPDKRIVQAWRDPAWGPGIHSIVKFELTPQGSGTHLVLDHTGFPAGQFTELDSGWHEHYLEPMKKYLR